jgi:hypothetical protein
LLRFEYYYNNWLDIIPYTKDEANLTTNLTVDFFRSLKFDSDTLKTYRKNAVNRLLPMLGDKPALCFSGGIDSQATWQCFNDAGVDIDVYVLVFKDDLNVQDVSSAIKFAEYKKIKINFIEIDILNFLSRENTDYSQKYKSLSPHFNTHYKLCDILRSKGYTGFVHGGGTPILTAHIEAWASNFSRNFLNYITYSEVTGILCQGNFLGFDPYLTWAITLLTPTFTNENYNKNAVYKKEHDLFEYQRYLDKIKGYRASGFDIIPQERKYTGFELVKQKLESVYGDGWAFEKFYRYPLKRYAKDIDVVIHFSDDLKEEIKRLNFENFRPSIDAPTGI